jgi:hypothetical protein
MKSWARVLIIFAVSWASYRIGYLDERGRILDVCTNEHKALIINDVWYVCITLDKAYPNPPKE